METIRGRTSLELDVNGFAERLANHNRIILDLGTGDGRYARTLAREHPDWFVVGLDACRENLREHSRAKLPNLLFAIASAQQLPKELDRRVSHVAINFPWGSLLQGLLAGEPALLYELESVLRAGALLHVRLNGGALAEAGYALEVGTDRIYRNLLGAGWKVKAPVTMTAGDLQSFPSTWAKRLAHGRDPRAMRLSARK